MSYSHLNKEIIGNDAFLGAHKKLSASVQMEYGILLLESMNGYLGAILEGNETYLDTLTEFYAVVFVIALLHVAMGTPLFLSDELLDAWAVNGGAGASECERCGYRHPSRFQACVICGGAAGEGGVWAARRARMAGMN